MTGAAEGLRLSLESKPESVGAARRAVADYALGLGVRESRLGDLKTTVTEAGSNVVRHAYPSGEGTIEIEARPEEEALTVIVRDSGVGIRPVLVDKEPCSRLGLGLIAALAERYEIANRPGGGTEVRFTVAL
jgi:anti-sigma regulatory factor (Ser/Thr protein kinase)